MFEWKIVCFVFEFHDAPVPPAGGELRLFLLINGNSVYFVNIDEDT